MRLGVLIPTRGVVMQSARRPPVEECWAMAREADAAGFDAVWVGDSVVAKPRLEAMTTLAYLAAITSRVRLGTAVLLPALRQPVILAQLIANVDQISRGRLVLGRRGRLEPALGRAGVGGLRDGPPAAGAPAGGADRALAGALERRAASRCDGPGFALTEHTIGPLPWTPGGAADPDHGRQSRRDLPGPVRAVRPARRRHHHDLRRRPRSASALRERGAAALEAHGRARPDFPLCVYTTVRLDDDVARCRARHRRVPGDLLRRHPASTSAG